MEPIVPQQEGGLADLISLANNLRTTEGSIAAMEESLKLAKEHAKQLSEIHIPGMMANLGLTELTLVGGAKIKIRPEFFGSVAQSRMEQAVLWLKANHMEGIIKRAYTITAHEEYNQAELDAIAAAAGAPVEEKVTINPQTLKAFVRERFEANDPTFPKELFAASQVNKAVIV